MLFNAVIYGSLSFRKKLIMTNCEIEVHTYFLNKNEYCSLTFTAFNGNLCEYNSTIFALVCKNNGEFKFSHQYAQSQLFIEVNYTTWSSKGLKTIQDSNPERPDIWLCVPPFQQQLSNFNGRTSDS